MWLQAITALGGWVFEIFKGKQEIARAKTEGKIKRVQNWETKMAEGSTSSWKDEFWTLILAIPMVLCFFPGMVVHIEAGFAALEGMPEWYRWAAMLSIGASFGFRGFDKLNIAKTIRR